MPPFKWRFSHRAADILFFERYMHTYAGWLRTGVIYPVTEKKFWGR